MTINPIAMTIRAKKLGVLIRDARIASGKSPGECAEAIGVAPTHFADYELGEASPSLPELEILADNLAVPLEHFWGNVAVSQAEKTAKKIDPVQLVKIRQRIIGVKLKQARQQAGLSPESLSEKAGIAPESLKSYEFGERPIPFPHLQALTQALGRPMKDLQDRGVPAGQTVPQQLPIQGFDDMPAELLSFISKPINRPYLELARRLSEMSVEKLRAVAEGLLEITL